MHLQRLLLYTPQISFNNADFFGSLAHMTSHARHIQQYPANANHLPYMSRLTLVYCNYYYFPLVRLWSFQLHSLRLDILKFSCAINHRWTTVFTIVYYRRTSASFSVQIYTMELEHPWLISLVLALMVMVVVEDGWGGPCFFQSRTLNGLHIINPCMQVGFGDTFCQIENYYSSRSASAVSWRGFILKALLNR